MEKESLTFYFFFFFASFLQVKEKIYVYINNAKLQVFLQFHFFMSLQVELKKYIESSEIPEFVGLQNGNMCHQNK